MLKFKKVEITRIYDNVGSVILLDTSEFKLRPLQKAVNQETKDEKYRKQ